MEQKSYEKMVKHLDHENELVIQAMSGALCNLALDPLHTTELGESQRAVLLDVMERFNDFLLP